MRQIYQSYTLPILRCPQPGERKKVRLRESCAKDGRNMPVHAWAGMAKAPLPPPGFAFSERRRRGVALCPAACGSCAIPPLAAPSDTASGSNARKKRQPCPAKERAASDALLPADERRTGKARSLSPSSGRHRSAPAPLMHIRRAPPRKSPLRKHSPLRFSARSVKDMEKCRMKDANGAPPA